MIRNYETMTMRQYFGVLAALNSESETKDIEVLSVLSGKSVDDLMQLPIPDYLALKAEAAFIFEVPEPEPEPEPVYRCGEYELLPVTDVRKITTRQWVDAQNAMGGDSLSNNVAVLTSLLVPRGHAYKDGYDYEYILDHLADDLNAVQFLTLQSFFLIAFAVLDFPIRRSLVKGMSREQRRVMRKMLREYRTSLRSGVGTIASELWAELPAKAYLHYIHSLLGNF